MLVRVRHLNVVMVHGADVHGGRLGFWMDFVEGSTLHDAIYREGPRSSSEALAWGQDLCRALAAVHNAGIVHRDVKAQNVMRRATDGRLVLMDFGAGEILGASRTGRGVGTPLYLAPEVIDGAPASRSSDIYALGVLLFFLVSRKFPVRANTWDELLAAHRRRERVRLEDVRPDMPPSFIDVIERALRPDPSQRYASAGEMLAALRSGNDSGPLTVTPPQPLPLALTPPPAAASPVRQAAIRLGAVALGLFGLTLALGYVACNAFEQILNIDPFFAVGLSGYLTVGRETLLPILLTWVAASALVAVFGGARDLLTTWRDADGPARPGILQRRRSRGPVNGDLCKRRAGVCGDDDLVLSGDHRARRTPHLDAHAHASRRAGAGRIEYLFRRSRGRDQFRPRVRGLEVVPRPRGPRQGAEHGAGPSLGHRRPGAPDGGGVGDAPPVRLGRFRSGAGTKSDARSF